VVLKNHIDIVQVPSHFVRSEAPNGCVPPLAAPVPRRLPPLPRLLLAIVVVLVRPQGAVRRPPLRVRLRSAAIPAPRPCGVRELADKPVLGA